MDLEYYRALPTVGYDVAQLIFNYVERPEYEYLSELESRVCIWLRQGYCVGDVLKGRPWSDRKSQVSASMETDEPPGVVLARDGDHLGRKQYARLKSYEALATSVVEACEGKPLSYYEILDDNAASRVFFDVGVGINCPGFVQWRADPDAFLRDVALPPLIAFLREDYGHHFQTTDFLVAEAHEPSRIRFQMTLPYQLRNHTHRSIFRRCLKQRRAQLPPEVYDSHVYGCGQLLRMLLCAKAGKTNVLKPVQRPWLAAWPADRKDQFVAFLTQTGAAELPEI